MRTSPNLAPIPDVRCPSCGASIKSSSTARRRKVQCPKCREVVELNVRETTPVAPEETTTEEVADLRARLSRLEAMEARIVALEKALEEAYRSRHVVGEAPAPVRKLRWVPSSDSPHDAGFTTESEDALLHNLNTFNAHAITIQSTAGDANARQRAEWLKEIFERARWSVRGPREVAPPSGERGLSLAVGALPLPSEAAETYLALTASGFSLNSLLDPNLAGDEAVLIVA